MFKLHGEIRMSTSVEFFSMPWLEDINILTAIQRAMLKLNFDVPV